MTTVTVVPPGAAQSITPDSYALRSWVLEQIAASSGSNSYRPSLLTMLLQSGVDPADWVTQNMWQTVMDCNEEVNGSRTIADIGGINGSVRCDGPTLKFLPGAGFSHNPAPVDSRMNGASAQIGTTFLRYSSAYNMVPVFALQSGTTLHCFGHYPDLLAEGLGLNPTSYPTITGSLTAYAPFVCTDHTANYEGQDSTSNVSFADVQITCPLAYKIAHFGDGDVTVETWGADFFSGAGKSFGGVRGWVKGMGLAYDLMINRVTVSSDVTGFQYDGGPQHCIEVQQQRSNAQMLRDPTMTESADTPLNAYRQKNCIGIKAQHRWIGLSVKGKCRIANTAIEMDAGTAPAAWSAHTTNPADPNYNAAYPAAHPDNGKFVACPLDINVEGVPTFLRAMPNTFLQRMEIITGGLFKDYLSATKQPVFDIRSSATESGTLKKDGTWKPSTQFSIGNSIKIRSMISDGPVFQNSTAEPARDWTIMPGSFIANWGHGGDTTHAWSQYAIVNLASTNNVIISTDAVTIYNGAYGSAKVFYTDDMNSINAGGTNRYMGYAGPDDTPTGTQVSFTNICNLQPFPAGGTYHPFSAPDDPDDSGGDG